MASYETRGNVTGKLRTLRVQMKLTVDPLQFLHIFSSKIRGPIGEIEHIFAKIAYKSEGTFSLRFRPHQRGLAGLKLQ